MTQNADLIRERFLKLGIDVPLEDIESRLDEMITKFKVPSSEAQRSVTNYFLKKILFRKMNSIHDMMNPNLPKL